MKKKTGPKPEMQKGTLHAEWFPAYGIRFREMPHVVVIGSTLEKAQQNLNIFRFSKRRDQNTDYDVLFTNEPFEVE